ncbi:MAG: potassium transporter Kup [Phycisphaerales bacterium]
MEGNGVVPGSRPKGLSYSALLTLGALGVVYGDIGTSPLYALRECFGGHHLVGASRANVFGVLSLILWSLALVVSVKYLVFILRADNRGEGGILALTALVTPMGETRTRRRVLILLGLFGAAMLYGDGMITPAISVLSAIEGLTIATPFFEPYVVLLTCVILLGLFLIQSKGTGRVGSVFGPVMVVWFTTLGVLGVRQIARDPTVLMAINPYYAVRFFAHNGWAGFWVLGSVFLVVTGGEALYADMGHFGRRAIRWAWFGCALPGLVLNYFGQGALILADPTALDNPFYRMAPQWALYPLVALAAAATVIASQALISGAFSLTMQAIQLGYSPRMTIRHTSSAQRGQIYLPFVNWTLMLSCIGLVVGFKSSSNLAAAYGIAVTTTMSITTILFGVVAWRNWKWPMSAALALAAFFLAFDLAFLGANVVKIPHGGWFPIVVAAAVFILMTTWKTGRRVVAQRLAQQTVPFDSFLVSIRRGMPLRVPGAAVFMYSSATGTPPALLHNLKHNKVLHERVILLTVRTEDLAHVPPVERVGAEALGEGFFRVRVRYGFMDEPDIPAALALVPSESLPLDPMQVTYFLGRENLIPSSRPGMARWREALFAWMSRNAQSATAYFRLPPNRVVELGAQIEL